MQASRQVVLASIGSVLDVRRCMQASWKWVLISAQCCQCTQSLPLKRPVVN